MWSISALNNAVFYSIHLLKCFILSKFLSWSRYSMSSSHSWTIFWKVYGGIIKCFWAQSKKFQFFSLFQVFFCISYSTDGTHEHLVELQPLSQPELCQDELQRKCIPDKLYSWLAHISAFFNCLTNFYLTFRISIRQY